VQRFARERKVGFAERLVLGGVSMDERGHVLRVGVPVGDQLGLADELPDARTHHVYADHRTTRDAHQLHETLGREDLTLAVAAEVVGQGLDVLRAVLVDRLGLRDSTSSAPYSSIAWASVSPTEATSGSQ